MTFIFSHFCCLLRRLIALQLWFVSIVPVRHSPFAAGGVCGVQCAHSKMKMQQEVNIKSDLRLRHIIYCQYLLEQSFLSCVFFARGKRSNERLALRFLWILCKVCLCMAFNVVESVCVRFSGGNLIQLEKLKTIQLAPMKIEPQSPIPKPQSKSGKKNGFVLNWIEPSAHSNAVIYKAVVYQLPYCRWTVSVVDTLN